MMPVVATAPIIFIGFRAGGIVMENALWIRRCRRHIYGPKPKIGITCIPTSIAAR